MFKKPEIYNTQINSVFLLIYSL